MNQAEIMREKQRKADLKKQGIDPDEEVAQPKKTWDDSYLKKYQIDYGEEEDDMQKPEEEKKEETLEEAKMAP